MKLNLATALASDKALYEASVTSYNKALTGIANLEASGNFKSLASYKMFRAQVAQFEANEKLFEIGRMVSGLLQERIVRYQNVSCVKYYIQLSSKKLHPNQNATVTRLMSEYYSLQKEADNLQRLALQAVDKLLPFSETNARYAEVLHTVSEKETGRLTRVASPGTIRATFRSK